MPVLGVGLGHKSPDPMTTCQLRPQGGLLLRWPAGRMAIPELQCPVVLKGMLQGAAKTQSIVSGLILLFLVFH